MNKDRIAALLKEPARVAREDLAGLRELKERYPWFSGAHLLLAMGENASGDVLFDDTLLTTAAHVPSREVLWENVHDVEVIPDGGAVATEPVPATAADEAKAEEPVIEAPVPLREELAQRVLDQQIVEAAVGGAYSLDDVPEPMLTVVPEDPIVPTLRMEPPTVQEEEEAVIDLSPRSFTSWLEEGPATEVPTIPFDQGASRPVGAQDWLRDKSGEAGSSLAKPASTPELTRDLIDRFLQQTTPEPRRTEFFSAQQAGKRSVEEKLDIATETLARIHEKQGHWAKAARLYHSLALKHPEKSGYFAALAKKAEQNLNP